MPSFQSLVTPMSQLFAPFLLRFVEGYYSFVNQHRDFHLLEFLEWKKSCVQDFIQVWTTFEQPRQSFLVLVYD